MRAKSKAVLAVLVASVFLVGAVAAASFTPYFKSTNSVSIDPNLTIQSAGTAYNIGMSFETVPATSWTSCTLVQAPDYACTLPATVYPNDEVVYGLVVSSPHASVTPAFNVTGNGFTTASYYATLTSSGGYASNVVSGLPAMAAGVSYSIWLVLTFGPASTSRTTTIDLSFGY